MTVENAPTKGGLSRAIRCNALLLGLIAAHAAAALVSFALIDLPSAPSLPQQVRSVFGVMIPLLVPVFLLIALLRRFVHMAVTVRPARPLGWFLADLRSVLGDRGRVAEGLLTFLAVSAFFASFAYFKALIPLVNDFSWDPLFARLDYVLHGARHPYELSFRLFGTPGATTALNAVYHFWLFLVYFVVFLSCFATRDRSARNSFLFGWVLIWAIGGNLLAAVFSSAGPVYYASLGLGPDFEPIRAVLEAFAKTSPVWALEVQDMLWAGYASGGPVQGISAMPSMHVASSVLLALYGFRYARWAGIALSLFALLIVIGSVHLGWHYAIDSYAGIALALAGWKAGGWLAARQAAMTG